MRYAQPAVATRCSAEDFFTIAFLVHCYLNLLESP